MIPTYDHVVLSVLSEVDELLQDYIFNGYSAISNFLRAPLGVIAAMYLVILGYGIAAGWVQMQVGYFIKVCIRIGLIYMAVTQWSWVSQYFVNAINQAIGGMGDAIIAASPVRIPGVDGIDGAMQEVLIEFTKLGSLLFQIGGWTNLGAWLDGILVWAFGYILIAIALFQIILAKVLLAILFIFTPLMALCCFFKSFHGVFDRWLGAIVSVALLQLFVTAALTIGLSMGYWWVSEHVGQQALQIGNFGTLPIIIVDVISIGMIFKAAELAYSIGGIAMTSSSHAMLGGMVGSMIGASISNRSQHARQKTREPKPFWGSDPIWGSSKHATGVTFVSNMRAGVQGGD